MKRQSDSFPIKRKDFPREVHIGSEIYTVKFVRKFKDPAQVGECDPETREIRIKCGQPRVETFKTYLHELIHAVEMELDIPITHKDVYKLENFLFDFLVKNLYLKIQK